MPKKNGIVKTYSFSVDTIEKLEKLCVFTRRSQTNCIEKLIEDKFNESKCFFEEAGVGVKEKNA